MYLQCYDDYAISHLKFVSKMYNVHLYRDSLYGRRVLCVTYSSNLLSYIRAKDLYIFPSTHKMFTIHKNEYTFAVKITRLYIKENTIGDIGILYSIKVEITVSSEVTITYYDHK